MEDTPPIQMILVILIGIVYGIGAVIKKIDRWIQVHRLPREMRPDQAPPPPPPPEAPEPQKMRRPEPTVQPKPSEARTILMRELQRALGVPETVLQPQESEPEQPSPAPEEAPPPEPPRRRKKGASVTRKAADGRKVTQTGILVEEAARVARRDMGHLALLRTREDLKRAVLLHEILSPPRSLRRLGPRQAAHSLSR